MGLEQSREPEENRQPREQVVVVLMGMPMEFGASGVPAKMGAAAMLLHKYGLVGRALAGKMALCLSKKDLGELFDSGPLFDAAIKRRDLFAASAINALIHRGCFDAERIKELEAALADQKTRYGALVALRGVGSGKLLDTLHVMLKDQDPHSMDAAIALSELSQLRFLGDKSTRELADECLRETIALSGQTPELMPRKEHAEAACTAPVPLPCFNEWSLGYEPHVPLPEGVEGGDVVSDAIRLYTAAKAIVPRPNIN